MEGVFGVVYLIWNMVNSKRYVGQTVQPLKRRFNSHAHCKKSLIGKAIRKYGKENFRYGVIKSCASKAEMDYWEKYFIAAFKSNDKKIGYNQTDGGEGSAGLERTPEYRAKLSAALSGEKNPHYGKKNTPEHTAKIVAACKGKKLSDEHCAKIKAALKGKKHTKERCAHISAAKRDDSPYKNLVAELDANNLSYAAFSKLAGIAKISLKMRGIRNFTKRDKENLVKIFDKPLEYLLECDDALIAAKLKHEIFYKNLVNEMIQKQISKTDLAKLLNLSKRNIFGKMCGEDNFTERDKENLVKIFDKPLEYLLESEPCPEIENSVKKKRAPFLQADCAKRSVALRAYSPYKNLIAELDAHKLSYKALERLMGVPKSTMPPKIRGECNFNERDKAKLVEVFNKPLEYLLARADG